MSELFEPPTPFAQGDGCEFIPFLSRCYVSNFSFSNSLNISSCDPGYFCPFVVEGCPQTYPQFCPPTIDCMEKRLGSSFCDAQGKFEPTLCLPGFYCPDQYTQLPCPENTYCVRGTANPIPCPLMSYCPPQTTMRRFYGGVVACIIIDVFLVALFFFIKYRLEPASWKARRAARRAVLDGGSSGSGVVESGYELGESLLKGPDADEAYSTLLGGPPEDKGIARSSARLSREAPSPAVDAPRLNLLSSKAVLRDGFLRSNAGLRLNLAFEGLTLTLPAPVSKTILAGVSGSIRPGRVTAIMGPSGAGKTTFLSVLMGKLPRTSGELRINGEVDEMYRYKKMTGFVPQDDTMMTELTVRENIAFAAHLRLPRTGWSAADINRHVDAVIEALGLVECADTLATSISGGQRKRTNIGIELAMAPAAIFLDEPTSGLDATAALEVCNTLRDIADLGLTVVAVIHQPRLEIFKSFDDLLLLAPGGLTVFIGPQLAALPYFQDLGVTFAPGYNPADELLDFIGGSGSACETALDGGVIKALVRNVGTGEGSGVGGGSPTKGSGLSASVPSVGTQLANHWRSEGHLAALLSSSSQRIISGGGTIDSRGSLQQGGGAPPKKEGWGMRSTRTCALTRTWAHLTVARHF